MKIEHSDLIVAYPVPGLMTSGHRPPPHTFTRLSVVRQHIAGVRFDEIHFFALSREVLISPWLKELIAMRTTAQCKFFVHAGQALVNELAEQFPNMRFQ